MSVVRSVIFSPAWGRREHFVGELGEKRFSMRVRHAYSNGFTRIAYGWISPTASGCHLSVRFQGILWIMLLIRALWIVFLLPALTFLWELLRYPTPSDARQLLVGVLAHLLTFGLLIAVEVIGVRLGLRDEKTMREHLARLFADAHPSV